MGRRAVFVLAGCLLALGCSGDEETSEAARDPGAVHAARVEKINMRAELNDDGRPGVKLRAALDHDDTADFRPGATAYAKIHCGRRPLAYVWLSDVIEYVRGWLVF